MNKEKIRKNALFNERIKGYEKDILTCNKCGIDKPKEDFPVLQEKGIEFYSFMCRECVEKKKRTTFEISRKSCIGCVHNSELRDKCKIGLQASKECPEYDEVLYSGGFIYNL